MNTGSLDRRQSGSDLFEGPFHDGQDSRRGVACCNRGRYSNPEVDKLLEAAINEVDRAKAKELYTKAWEMISNDLPLLAALVSGEHGRRKQTDRQYQDQPERRLEFYQGHNGRKITRCVYDSPPGLSITQRGCMQENQLARQPVVQYLTINLQTVKYMVCVRE